MKNVVFILLSSFLLMGCPSNEELEVKMGVVGDWQLAAIYLDPGDGSGDYEDVDSDKVLRFFDDGTWSSNGTMCSLSEESNKDDSGDYDEVDMVISVPDCSPNFSSTIRYEIVDNELILTFQCIEACLHKYVKI